MSPLSPGEKAPSSSSPPPLSRSLHPPNRSNGDAPKFRRSADRKAEVKGHARKTESTKTPSPRAESTPELKVSSMKPGCLFVLLSSGWEAGGGASNTQ